MTYLKHSLALLLAMALLVGCSATGSTIQKGDTLPTLVLRDLHGQRVHLNERISKKPAVLIYYRGGWCPYCNIQLKGLRLIEKTIKAKGYDLYAISPDSPQSLSVSAKEHHLGYTLLSDSRMEGAKRLGIAFEVDETTLGKYSQYGIDIEAASGGETHHLLPKPAVIIVNRNNKVTFVHIHADYKVRLSNDEILSRL